MEIKRISVEVTCDTLIFEGKYYEKGKVINNFPYSEKDHGNNAKPIEEKKAEVIEPVEEIKVEEKKAEISEPVKEKKGRK